MSFGSEVERQSAYGSEETAYNEAEDEAAAEDENHGRHDTEDQGERHKWTQTPVGESLNCCLIIAEKRGSQNGRTQWSSGAAGCMR